MLKWISWSFCNSERETGNWRDIGSLEKINLSPQLKTIGEIRLCTMTNEAQKTAEESTYYIEFPADDPGKWATECF